MYYSFIGFFSHFKLYLFHDLKDQKRVLHFFVVSTLPMIKFGYAHISVLKIGISMPKTACINDLPDGLESKVKLLADGTSLFLTVWSRYVGWSIR